MTSLLSRALAKFSTGPFTVTRRGEGTYGDDGVHIQGEASIFPIQGSIQPLSGTELLALPDAQRSGEIRLVLTPTELKTRSGGFAPDRLTIAGETWEVIKVEAWHFRGGIHYRAHIALLPEAT